MTCLLIDSRKAAEVRNKHLLCWCWLQFVGFKMKVRYVYSICQSNINLIYSFKLRYPVISYIICRMVCLGNGAPMKPATFASASTGSSIFCRWWCRQWMNLVHHCLHSTLPEYCLHLLTEFACSSSACSRETSASRQRSSSSSHHKRRSENLQRSMIKIKDLSKICDSRLVVFSLLTNFV